MKRRSGLRSAAVQILAVAACVVASMLVAPAAFAQCPDLSEAGTHHYANPADPSQGFNSVKNLNALGLIFRAAGNSDINCVAAARDALTSHLIDVRRKRGSSWWQEFLSGTYINFVMAAGMEISGRGLLTEELDLLIRDAGEDYRFVFHAPDPCGLLADDPEAPGKQMARRANNCMDDYTIAASGFGWKAAYWRLSGRFWQGPRIEAIDKMRRALLSYDSVCLHSPSKYQADKNAGIAEPKQCNITEADLDSPSVPDAQIISLNHGNQAISYGFGLLTSMASGVVALEVMEQPLSAAGEFSPNERKVMKYLWKEAAEHTDANGMFFNRSPNNNGNCLNMAGPRSGNRVLVGGWGCEDQQFAYGDATEGGPERAPEPGEVNGYMAKWYALGPFYDHYGFTKGTGTGSGWQFNVFDGFRLSDSINEFYGPARKEAYFTLANAWLFNRPPLTARSEFRLSIKTANDYGGRYFYAMNGGGSTVEASAASPGVTNTNFEIVDLNGATLISGDPVAIRIKNAAGTPYYLTAPSSGGLVSATATTIGNNETFYIERITTGGRLISHLDRFALRSKASNKYMEAANGGGGAIFVNPTVVGTYSTFMFSKTELPRRVY